MPENIVWGVVDGAELETGFGSDEGVGNADGLLVADEKRRICEVAAGASFEVHRSERRGCCSKRVCFVGANMVGVVR